MAIRTTALTPFNPTAIPDRSTPVFVTDKTKVTTTVGTGAIKRLNRLQSASFSSSTPVTEVSEMGASNRVGGIDELGETKFQFGFDTVSMQNAANIAGKAIDTVSGHTTTIGYNDLQSARVDIMRLVADSVGTIFGTLYMQDGVLEEYNIDAKTGNLVTDSFSGMAPNCTFFPGFVIPKTYVVLGGDITAGVCTIHLSSVLGADEAPVEIYLPPAGQPPEYWPQQGAQYFLKVEQIPGANLANNPVRFWETGADSAHTVTYNNSTQVLTFPNGAVTAGDLFRIVLMSYNTDSFPLTIPTAQDATWADPSERAAISTRLTPISYNSISGALKRVQSAQLKLSFKREHVQGIGETTIIYGPSSIPDVALSFDMKEYDNRMLTLLKTGQQYMSDAGGTFHSQAVGADFIEMSSITRNQLATATPFNIVLNDPFSVGTVLLTVSCPQFVVKDVDFSSSNKSDNTVKINAMDITGTLTLSYTHP